MTWENVRKIAATLPGLEEGTSYGTPALRVRRKFVARLWEDGETLVVKLTFGDRDTLLDADPDIFFTTDHYRNHPSVLVRLRRVRRAQLEDLLERAWRLAAPKSLVAQREA